MNKIALPSLKNIRSFFGSATVAPVRDVRVMSDSSASKSKVNHRCIFCKIAGQRDEGKGKNTWADSDSLTSTICRHGFVKLHNRQRTCHSRVGQVVLRQKETYHLDTELLFADDEYVAFRDYRPAGEHHYLIIPRDHVKSVGVLSSDDVPMVRRMEEIARQVSRDRYEICEVFAWKNMELTHMVHTFIQAAD